MTTLHDRLADLADDAPPGGPAPELWERATRYHRARRAGTIVITAIAVVTLLLTAGYSWLRAKPGRPAGNRISRAAQSDLGAEQVVAGDRR